MRRLRGRAIAALLLYGLVSSGLGAQDPVGALRWRGSPQVGAVEAPEVTEPSRLVGESSGGEVRKQQLDTRVRQEPPGGPPVHLAQVSFVIPAFNSNFTLDLELNHHLLSSQYVERHFSREGTTQHSTGAGDHCYYQGKLRGNPQSFAANLHLGVFSDGNLTYIVEPQEMAGTNPPSLQGPLPHLIYRTPLLSAPLGCREPGCLFAAPARSAPPNRPRLRRKRSRCRMTSWKPWPGSWSTGGRVLPEPSDATHPLLVSPSPRAPDLGWFCGA
uniref:Peptidase M12B propeptide domain-containing protein n=1 Tax=Sciurus vulgaris TaxID=55149 RepID=A0A8D2CJP0_SCIVU